MKTFFTLFSACYIVCSGVLAEAPVAKVGEVKNVTPEEVVKLIKENPKTLVLDVRTPEEFAAGHIAGATNADIMNDDFAQKIAKLAKDQPVVVHCGSGTRSAKALPTIVQQKFPVIYHMNGGFTAWKAAGKPVEKQ